MNKKEAIVIFSGGQDSTTCLFWAIDKFDKVIALSFDYNQRHIEELEYAREICKKNDIEHYIFDLNLLNQLAPNSLTRMNINVDKDKPEEGVPNSFVDGRNMLFLTFTAIFAKQRDINNIVIGVSQSDYSGYPDCRDIFIKSVNVTLNLSMDYNFEIHTPLMWIDKAETWKLAYDLGILDIIKNETLTCYNGIKGFGCGQCPACKLRNDGYKRFEEILFKNYTS